MKKPFLTVAVCISIPVIVYFFLRANSRASESEFQALAKAIQIAEAAYKADFKEYSGDLSKIGIGEYGKSSEFVVLTRAEDVPAALVEIKQGPKAPSVAPDQFRFLILPQPYNGSYWVIQSDGAAQRVELKPAEK